MSIASSVRIAPEIDAECVRMLSRSILHDARKQVQVARAPLLFADAARISLPKNMSISRPVMRSSWMKDASPLR
jgi:hypothetical protein